MNQYCTLAQLYSFYDTTLISDLTDDAGHTKIIEPIVQLCLDSAASKIDSVLFGRYSLPIFPTYPIPLILTRITASLAMDMLYRRRSRVPDSEISTDILEANNWLKDVKVGLQGIPGVIRSGQLPTIINPLPSRFQSRCGPLSTDSIPDITGF